MTPAQFKQAVAGCQTSAGLDRLMIEFWPEVTGTCDELRQLGEVYLSRYIELETAPCEHGRRGAFVPETLHGILG